MSYDTYVTKMAERGVLLVFGLLVVSVTQCLGSRIPLIGWANSDVLSVKVADSVEVNGLVEQLHLESVDTVIVFRTAELSFDDIVKFGGSFGGTNAKFGNLEKSVTASKSSLWTGITGDFVHALALRMDTSAQTYSGKRDQSIPTNSKLLLVELSGGFGDSTVGTVMQQLEGKKSSYVAFYTSSRSSDVASNSRRSRAAASTSSGAAQEYTCLSNFSKVFTDTSDKPEKPCMLFCLTNSLTLDVGYNGTKTVVLATNTSAYRPDYYNSTNNVSGNVPPTVNQCTVTTSDNILNSTSIGFSLTETSGASSNVTDLSIVFIFPINNGANNYTYKYFWTMAVCVSGSYASNQFYTVLTRQLSESNPDNELFVPKTNSYACSSSQYSTYTPASVANDPHYLMNVTSLWLSCGFPTTLPGYNGSSTYTSSGMNLSFSLNVAGIQVQPYIVPTSAGATPSNSFDTPYTCEGYVSIPVLMGILSVVILVLILYLGNVFMFSIKTLDRFDDPRAPTISVDRLH